MSRQDVMGKECSTLSASDIANPTKPSEPNPRHSLRSTWRKSSRENWRVSHYLIHFIDTYLGSKKQKVPVYPKSAKVPYVTQWSIQSRIIIQTAIPLLLHQVYSSFVNILNRRMIFFLYLIFTFAILSRMLRTLRQLGAVYGYFDGDKHARDGIPDSGVSRIATGMFIGLASRLLLAMFLGPVPSQPLGSINWISLPLRISAYGLILDFWYYWAHRAMHEVDVLWRFHRTHHLSKHPNPLLTIYAGDAQEVFDLVAAPLAAYVTLSFILRWPMNFYEWWACQQYIITTELLGHSGLRLYIHALSPMNWVYSFLRLELLIEDHDLHHRHGWRKSQNYGKQTRVWDYVFGTCGERLECVEGNVDFVNVAEIPLF